MTVNDTVKRWSPFVKLALGLALAGGIYWVGFLHGRSEANAELQSLYDPLVKELVADRDQDRETFRMFQRISIENQERQEMKKAIREETEAAMRESTIRLQESQRRQFPMPEPKFPLPPDAES